MEERSISLTEARRYIDAIDFSNIINKMATQQGWLEKEAEATCRLYRNYLFLVKKYGDEYQLPPSQEIDEFWHNHILDTRQYVKDCQAIFGRYLHHDPFFDKEENSTHYNSTSAFETMQRLYIEEFNDEIIYQVRRFYSPLLVFFKNLFTNNKSSKSVVTT